jgi:hypothetical protein
MLQLLMIVWIGGLPEEVLVVDRDKDNEEVDQVESREVAHHVHHVRSQNLIVKLSLFVV